MDSFDEIIAIENLKNEVRHWAKKLGVSPKEIRIRPMKRKWASCSSKGTLTFNKELIYQPAEFRRYVIVHELLHLKIHNHGKLFKSLLKAYLDKCNDEESKDKI